jgi:sec-independent protein translocase protein TatA
MPFLSHWYLIVGLVIVLIIFGPGKLPQIGSAVGTAIKEFRKATTELRDDIARSTEQHDSEAPVTGASFPQPAASTATHPEPEAKKEPAEAPKA